MSSYAEIVIGGQSLMETQNYYYEWYFRKKERVLTKDADGEAIYKYVMSGETLRRRLELAGHNLVSLQKEFDKQLDQMKVDCEKMIEIDGDGKAVKLLPILESSTLEDWLQRLRRIFEEKLKSGPWGQPEKDFGDPLLNFMMSMEEYYYSEDPGIGGHNFPARSHEGYAVALLEALPKDAECALDVTALISGGWTNAFDDLVEYHQDFTTFYGIFKTSLEDITALAQVAPTNEALARLLYAGVITAMETYLSDTLRKQIFEKQAIKRRFVESHRKFKDEKFEFRDIYSRFDKMDRTITEALDEISFHNMLHVDELYAKVLLIEIPKSHLANLYPAVAIRHDIVHRNGKSLKGKSHEFTMSDVEKLLEDVDAAIQYIDKQVKDGLLENLDDNED
jgi:hypothetical protein